MQKFRYKIIDSTSRLRQGEIEGETLEKVADNFLSQGFTILELKQAGFNFQSLKSINIGGIPFAEKVIFMRQMSFMINSGLPLVQALDIAKTQITNATFKKKIENVIKDVESGTSLYKSLERQGNMFDSVTKNLVRAGEESGKLDLIMDKIAENMEKSQEFMGKVKGALIYPVVILFAIVGVVAVLMIFMVPEMSKLYEGQSTALPVPTQIVVAISDFLTKGFGGVVTLIILISLVAAFIYYRKTPSGKIVTDKLIIKIPVAGELIRKSQVASFAGTFAMLIQAGVPILDALKLVADSTTNSFFQMELMEARKKVEKGIPLSAPIINSKAFPLLLGHMIRVGEETGKLDEVVSKVGRQYAKEVDQMASNLTRLMEPVILIVMGLVVGGIALAVYLPVLNLGAALSGG
jgi:type IV pilus assembly protein PilC